VSPRTSPWKPPPATGQISVYGVIVLADCSETVNDEMQRFALEVAFPLIARVSDAEEFAAGLKIFR